MLVHQEGPVHWFIVYFIVLYSLCFLVQCAPNYTITDMSLIIQSKGESTIVENRVSQKNQKSEFWNVPYPSGFHRLDEPPEKISAL